MDYRAIVGETLGGPGHYHVRTMPHEAPAAGQVRLAVAAAGVSFVDILVSAGGYQVRPPVPYVPSLEFSGTIVERGAAVTGFAVGDRVAVSAMGGGFAECALVDAAQLIGLPKELGFVEAAAAYIGYQTAYHALVQRGRLARGETVLVLGASGAISTAAIEMARAHGATVVASASGAAKCDAAVASGAAIAIDARAGDWRDRIRAATGGRGADLIFDPVGGEETERAFRAIAWNGRHLVVGFAAGDVPAIRTNLALLKGGALIGVDIRQFREKEPAGAARNLAAINGLIAEGALIPRVERVFAFDAYRDAMRHAVSRERIGRTVLDVAGSTRPG